MSRAIPTSVLVSCYMRMPLGTIIEDFVLQESYKVSNVGAVTYFKRCPVSNTKGAIFVVVDTKGMVGL